MINQSNEHNTAEETFLPDGAGRVGAARCAALVQRGGAGRGQAQALRVTAMMDRQDQREDNERERKNQ